MIRKRIVFGAAIVALFALGWWAGRGHTAGGLYSNLDSFIEILHRIDETYVDPVEPTRLVSGAIQGVMKQLDPYSQYLDARSWSNLKAKLRAARMATRSPSALADSAPMAPCCKGWRNHSAICPGAPRRRTSRLRR